MALSFEWLRTSRKGISVLFEPTTDSMHIAAEASNKRRGEGRSLSYVQGGARTAI